MKPIKVYVASKLRHADKLKKAFAALPTSIHLNCRWIDMGNLASNSARPVPHWQEENFVDIVSSDYVWAYAEEGEHLKGALVEIGYALASGKFIILIGNHPDYESWGRYTQQIRHSPTIEDAAKLILQYENQRSNQIVGRGITANG